MEAREMVHCERCSSRFHSARALMIENCPRCLLRDDVAAPLVVEPVEIVRADADRARPGSEPAAKPLDPEAGVAT
jgi:predicted  nucleic acid-binding Zn-ribbon protein